MWSEGGNLKTGSTRHHLGCLNSLCFSPLVHLQHYTGEKEKKTQNVEQRTDMRTSISQEISLLQQMKFNFKWGKKINKVHTCWYFTSLPEYVVVDNCICQSETFPPPPSSQFSESASRDVHLIKEKSQSAFEGPTRNLLMSSRCLATDALILAPWKIFPGVCSFMHCCTIIKIIKLFP